VELDLRDGQQLSSEWPPAAGGSDDFELAVTDRGETLGRITVSSAPGRNLRAYDRRLLADFSSQLGLALRNARLEAELQLSVKQVTRRAEELAVSRRRLVAARDDERRRLSAAIDTQVLSHLGPLVDDLPDLVSVADSNRMEAVLDRQILAANSALDALRRLSHGPVPAVLRRRGLAAALGGLGAGFDLHVAPSAERRFDAQVETAAYLCARAAMSSATPAAPGQLILSFDGDRLVMIVEGVDEQVADGPDWPGVVDRVEALSGTVVVGAGPDGSATLRLELPTSRGGGHAEFAQTDASVSGPNADLAT
jgi:signal transduction histidine kinase